jgi:hypothetical protein
VCTHLRSRGVNATSIGLGVVAEIGFAAEHIASLPHLRGTAKISERQLLAIIESAMAGRLEHACPVIGLSTGGMARAVNIPDPHWFVDPRLGGLRVHGTQEMDAGDDALRAGSGDNMADALARAGDLGAAAEVVCEEMRSKLARGLMMDVEDLDAGRPANAYGVDSLVAVELRAWAKKEVRATVSVFEILSNVSMAELARMIAERSELGNWGEGKGEGEVEGVVVNGDESSK